jgi:hypothetical protein
VREGFEDEVDEPRSRPQQELLGVVVRGTETEFDTAMAMGLRFKRSAHYREKGALVQWARIVPASDQVQQEATIWQVLPPLLKHALTALSRAESSSFAQP